MSVCSGITFVAMVLSDINRMVMPVISFRAKKAYKKCKHLSKDLNNSVYQQVASLTETAVSHSVLLAILLVVFKWSERY
jgi:hypothetical protein